MPSALKIFLLVSLALLVACQQNSTSVDHPFEPGGGNVRLAALAGGSEDKLLATVSGRAVSFVHSGAVFNCCLDSLKLEMYSRGGILRVLELQHCDQPCDCSCEYAVHGEVDDLDPGYYTLEICADSLARQALCSVSFRIGE